MGRVEPAERQRSMLPPLSLRGGSRIAALDAGESQRPRALDGPGTSGYGGARTPSDGRKEITVGTKPAAAASEAGEAGGADLTRGGRRDKNGLCSKCDKDHDSDACVGPSAPLIPRIRPPKMYNVESISLNF